MLPISITNGLERYLLVRRGSSAYDGSPVTPTRARAVLEAVLRRREPRLINDLSAELNLRGHDVDALARQMLTRLRETGTIGANLELLQMNPREAPRLDPRPPIESAPPEPLAPDPICEEEPEEDPPPARTSIRVSMFFDGTQNNRANTRARLNHSASFVAASTGDDSYMNDFSNVSRLETLCIGDSTFEHSLSIYVEGIGTTNHDSDSWKQGVALGMGPTGVVAKVERGVRELLRSIRELGLARGVIIERIHIDAFGFSRGSAAARYFVHVILEGDDPLQPRIEASGHPVEQLQVHFVGLFDTVASYGADHTNDTSDLHLDSIRAALKVVQLAAAEEHRENFPLTNIASAGAAGVQIFLPGVHSDVGGGYTATSEEVELQILDFDGRSDDAMERRFAREREWLIESGWYLPDEIAAVSFWNELKVTRRGISNRYNRIPLRHMANFATETGLTFDPIDDHFPIPPALHGIRDTIAAHVAAHLGGTTSTANHWINMRGPEFQRLRHDYLHFSAFYGSTLGGNAPHFTGDNPMTGRRQRVVHPG